ncbi:DUF305 domain-containing protein [Deinococcus sp. YIM 134068]|uniref:DUF305 domain-containing protein n=1 Tax=Deinococcus lichenicola TaxID=3118910 RepID=UPI002F925128
MRAALLLTLALTGGALAGTHTGHGGHGASTATGKEAGPLDQLRPLLGWTFDVRFALRMMDHHQMAVDMARAELRLGNDARVKAAAREVIATQEKEIAQLGAWVRKWTGKSYTPRSMSMSPKGDTDRWFLEGMIPHHEGAVEMARLVPARSQNPQVRQLAARIVRTQTAEINQYRAWLKDLP